MQMPIGISADTRDADRAGKGEKKPFRERLPTRKRMSNLYQNMQMPIGLDVSKASEDGSISSTTHSSNSSRTSRMSSILGVFNLGKSIAAVAPQKKAIEEKETFDQVLFNMIDSQNRGKIEMLEVLNFFDAHSVLSEKDVKVIAEHSKLSAGQGTMLTREQFRKLILKMDLATEGANIQKRMMAEESSKDDDEKDDAPSVSRRSRKNRLPPKWAYGDGSFAGRTSLGTSAGGSVVFGKSLSVSHTLPWYIFGPKSGYRMAWDVVILVLLVYTMVVMPLRLGFDLEASVMGFWFWLETFIDLAFIVDVGINFFTSYTDDDTGKLVVDLPTIAQSYIFGWFSLDLVSSIPFDFIQYASGAGDTGDYGVASSAKTLKTGRLIKVLRIFKLSKLLRLARAVNVGRRLEENLDLVGRAPIKIFKIVFATLFMSHIFACGWAGMARVNGERTFMTNSWASMWGVTTSGITKEYLSALYWSVTTLTTVGYGDISPQDNAEMIFAAFAMIAGGAFYGYIVAKLAALMQGIDANARVYHERMDAIVSYMRQRNFPKQLFHRVSRYYQHYFQRKTALDESAILAGLSDALQLDVCRYLAHDMFDRSYLFSEMPDGVLTRLLNELMPIKSTPDEVIFQMGDPGKDLFIITLGNVFAFDRNGDILMDYASGSVFGEFAPLGLIGGRLFHTQCRNMVELCSISKSALEDACYEYPGTFDKFIRKARRSLKSVVRTLGLGTRSVVLRALQTRKSTVVASDPAAIPTSPTAKSGDVSGDRADIAALSAKIDRMMESVAQMRADQAALVQKLAGK